MSRMRRRKRKTVGTRLHRAYHWLWDGMYDQLPPSKSAVEDPVLWRVAWRFEEAAKWTLCKVYGHEAERDQCGIPEHDFCVWCNRSMPNMAARTNR